MTVYESAMKDSSAIANVGASRASSHGKRGPAEREWAEKEGPVSRDAGEARDIYTEAGELRGVWTRGAAPKELVLSDGSRLVLQAAERGRVLWRRTEARDGDGGTLSVGEALDLAGDEFAGYVTVRTRAEAEWLRTVAEWCGEEAQRLDHELVGSGSSR